MMNGIRLFISSLIIGFILLACVSKPCVIPADLPQPDPRTQPDLSSLIKPKSINESGYKIFPRETHRGLTWQDIQKIILMKQAWEKYHQDVEQFMMKVKEANR